MKTCADIEDSSTACPVGFGYNATLTGSRSAINNNFTSDCCKVSSATIILGNLVLSDHVFVA